MCHLLPIDALQEPIDSELFKDEHNNMDCNFVSEDMFDLMQQPVIDSTVILESEFDSVLKCLTSNAQGVDADCEVDKRISLRNVKSEPIENEGSVSSNKKKIQCPSCPKEFISRLGFHKHFEKVHEEKLFCAENKEDSVEQNAVQPLRGRGKGPQNSLAQAPIKNGEQSSPSAQASNNTKETVSPKVKRETEKPVMKLQAIVQKVKKEKSPASAPSNGSVANALLMTRLTKTVTQTSVQSACLRLGWKAIISFTGLVKKFKFPLKKEKKSLSLYVANAKGAAHAGQT